MKTNGSYILNSMFATYEYVVVVQFISRYLLLNTIVSLHALGAQLFTSMKAELHQDINRVFVFSRCINET